MRQPLTALHRFAIGSLPLVVLCLAGCRDWSAPVAAQESADAQRPPLEIRFLPASGHRARQGEISCKVPAGRDQAYDPRTGVFHIELVARDFSYTGFEVTKVAQRTAQPIVFRLTGVPTGYGCLGHPLTLSAGEKKYALDPSCESVYWGQAEPFDATLFRSVRKEDEVTIELTDKGQALLQPGATISLHIDTGW